MGILWLRIDRCDSRERGNELLGSVQCWEVLEQLSDCCFHKNDSSPLS